MVAVISMIIVNNEVCEKWKYQKPGIDKILSL